MTDISFGITAQTTTETGYNHDSTAGNHLTKQKENRKAICNTIKLRLTKEYIITEEGALIFYLGHTLKRGNKMSKK